MTRMTRKPILELALLILLPLLILLAGAVTTGIAMQNGFTALAPGPAELPR